jgi:hypothetical protein
VIVNWIIVSESLEQQPSGPDSTGSKLKCGHQHQRNLQHQRWPSHLRHVRRRQPRLRARGRRRRQLDPADSEKSGLVEQQSNESATLTLRQLRLCDPPTLLYIFSKKKTHFGSRRLGRNRQRHVSHVKTAPLSRTMTTFEKY